jgi:hypothetical protein
MIEIFSSLNVQGNLKGSVLVTDTRSQFDQVLPLLHGNQDRTMDQKRKLFNICKGVADKKFIVEQIFLTINFTEIMEMLISYMTYL